ncbi:MAG: hypothetical protein EVA89_30940 [Sandaracinaceae bacterium]|nr:MAG: hypothetical protein EVA89_30940 [Sandaracinaceae bacterium]
MSDALRDAARRALEKVGAAANGGEVTRLTVDVKVDGVTEMVALALRGGELSWTSSSGEAEGPHVREALRWLAASAPALEEDVRSSSMGMRITETEIAPRASTPPPPPAKDEAAETPTARGRLADALDDVVTTVVRAGAGERNAPSVAESLERLRKEAPLPTPTGLARWLKRLEMGLAAKDVAQVARLLMGASQLAKDLRKERPSRSARRRVVGWMGASGELGAVERLSDRVLIEVAREWLPSSERGGIERRYLVDLRNGEVFREERSRSSPVASVGPCPRVIQVGLAEVEDGAAPRRIRLMQYAVSLVPSHDDLTRIASNAYRRFGALADRYREQLGGHPGQSEPFAIVAPKRWGEEGEAVAYDDDGTALAFARADDAGAASVLSQLAGLRPRWLGGRLVDADGALLLVPCVAALPDGAGTRLYRLR